MNHVIFDVPSWCIFGRTIRTNNDVECNTLSLSLSIISFHSLMKPKKLKNKADKAELTFIPNFKIYEVYQELYNEFTYFFLHDGTIAQRTKLLQVGASVAEGG